ncbi:MAG: hypothetical protein C0439_16940 [Pseudomonas sp.]|nr:hypothetical protein [Pseudomonas sp.]
MRAFFILGLIGSLATGQANAETITVAWRDKPPYHYLENGHERGFLLLRAKRIFALANVPAVFVERPSKRIWLDFENGKTQYCSIGWYKLPEREQVAQFSQPLHIDPPHMLLVNVPALPRIQAHKSLNSLLADPSIVLGVVDGVSYGPDLDRLMAHSANQIERMTLSPGGMMRMLAANRINYMLADQADWQFLREQREDLSQVTEYHFSDMPAGLQRFITCSKDVTADTMARINHAIAEDALIPEEQ